MIDSKSDDNTKNKKEFQDDGASVSRSTTSAKNSDDKLIAKLVRTGKFTEDEAEKFAAKHSNGNLK
jgi:hypothetical protein